MIRRLFAAFAAVWLAATLVFVALRFIPGDAITARLTASGATDAEIDRRRQALGLDEPVYVQYADYVIGLVRGEFGVSLVSGQPVGEMIVVRLPATVNLAVWSLIAAVVLGVLLGTGAAVHWWLATPCRWLIGLAVGAPVYWTATLVVALIAVELQWLPAAGSGSVQHLILPAFVLGFHSSGAIAQVVRTQLIGVRASEYVRFAHARGLHPVGIWWRYMMRPGLLPVITLVAVQAGFLLGGTVITEQIFARPGIGQLLLTATIEQDYPVVQGVVLVVVLMFITLNIVADLLYRVADPRVALV